MLSLLLVSALSVSPLTYTNQANALVGAWNIEYEAGRRIENGTPTVIMGKATLTIAQSGDSLVATLAPAPRDGATQPPVTFGGRTSAKGATFKQLANARVNVNGEQQSIPVTITWDLTAAGNTLTGTLLRSPLPGREPLPPAPVKGTRQ